MKLELDQLPHQLFNHVFPTGFQSADFTDVDADNTASSSDGFGIEDTMFAQSIAANFIHDKDLFFDNFFIRYAVASTNNTPFDCVFRVGYVNNGQTLADAIAADQFLSEAVSLTATADTLYEFDPLPEAKLEKGGKLFFYSNTQPTGLQRLIIGFRAREIRIDEP